MRTLAIACLAAVTAIGPAQAAAPLQGQYALPEGAPKVTATLQASTVTDGQVFDIAMIPLGATAPATAYDTELSKQLHVIAVSRDLRRFVHEHGEAPDKDGHFRIPIRLPGSGPWHVYADGVPKGLSQQVMRFELGAAARPAAPPVPTGLEGQDGRYAARFDAIDLQAGQEAELALHLLRDGQPAGDVTPFLGVAAHAVFIDAADLTYVHVHAAPAAMPGMATAQPADMPGMEGMGAPLPAGAKVPPELGLHVKAPKAGTYVLWIQFEGGGQVRTVRFVTAVR